MKIEEIIPLRGIYAARFQIPIPENMKGVEGYAEWRTIEFMGLVDGEWQALSLDDMGKLKPLHELPGELERIYWGGLKDLKEGTPIRKEITAEKSWWDRMFGAKNVP